jgi:hypothetical protein
VYAANVGLRLDGDQVSSICHSFLVNVFCVVFIVERNLLSPNLECASRQIETALCLVQVDAIFYCTCVSKLRAVKKLTLLSLAPVLTLTLLHRVPAAAVGGL